MYDDIKVKKQIGKLGFILGAFSISIIYFFVTHLKDQELIRDFGFWTPLVVGAVLMVYVWIVSWPRKE